MVTIRCTKKLMRRLRGADEAGTSPSTTVLGDWYANILFSRPQQLILCVSERTLLPVVILAKELDSFPLRLAASVRGVLARLGVPQELIEREEREMRQSVYGPTRSKRVLGSMNDFMYQLSWLLHDRPGIGLVDASLHLAETPCSPIGYKSPDDFTLELLGSNVSKTHGSH